MYEHHIQEILFHRQEVKLVESTAIYADDDVST